MPHLKDEELGKKDDDHRIPPARSWQLPQLSNIPRPRRLITALIGLVLVYQFFKHMPTDLRPARERYDPAIARFREQNPSPVVSPNEIPSDSETQGSKDKGKLYDGKIKLYELASSLPPDKHSENMLSNAVLFAGSNLHSIADMLPLACRMAREQRNHVHLALFGKEEVSVEGIKQVNGIVDSDCPIVWHDCRPDYAAQSTDDRLARSVKGGLGFIQTYIAPEVIITQSKDWEDSFFWGGLKRHLWEVGISHIALPTTSTDLMWIASIDSTALKVWNDIRVDIVVHASQSAGSLIRLLRSLDAADYLGFTPKLTIELPPQIDQTDLLGQLKDLSQLKEQITLRRRIQPHFMDPVEASLRTVESFYPLNPEVSHVLMLAPNTEVAPSFYHYLKYSILAYKQSARSSSSKLLGISLELPSTKPTIKDEPFISPLSEVKSGFIPSFLWQAPNSNAAMYFGDKWAEFHSFLSHRLDISDSKASIPSSEKLVSTRYPSFMEYLLEMMRAKGYYILYPSFPGTGASSLVTVHQDLSQSPEEFVHETKPGVSGDKDVDDIEMVPPGQKPNPELTIMTLFDTFDQGLPDMETLPLLSFDGEQLTQEKYSQQTKEYSQQFRAHYGGCSSNQEGAGFFPNDLFCLE
ncbi:uncharacterized protein N7484_009520 [Penicillium longicatenatum]|uniref:uncharacterized protein n=1 Tax=Penicillium longicatenatum TaxID=1561947 RepID=UPI0025467FDE|nr:uncharacterized protein N7484_009520 [Penicillium longicatenatum]KAJ5636207.1 hypothetical protein N7484_009520 [Penicillium longicatenatum]